MVVAATSGNLAADTGATPPAAQARIDQLERAETARLARL